MNRIATNWSLRRLTTMLAVGIVAAGLTWWCVTPQPWRTLTFSGHAVNQGFLSPDGKLFAVAYNPGLDGQGRGLDSSRDVVVRFVELDTGHEVAQWQGDFEPLGFSGDSRSMSAVSHSDRHPRQSGRHPMQFIAIDPLTGLVRTLLELDSPSDVASITLSNDQQTLVRHRRREDDPVLEVWDLPAGRLRGMIDLEGHDGNFFTISRDGRRLVLGDGWRGGKVTEPHEVIEPRGVRIWNLETCRLVTKITGYPQAVNAAYFVEETETLRMESVQRKLKLSGHGWDMRPTDPCILEYDIAKGELQDGGLKFDWYVLADFYNEMWGSCHHLSTAGTELHAENFGTGQWNDRPSFGLMTRLLSLPVANWRRYLGQIGVSWINTGNGQCEFELVNTTTGLVEWKRRWSGDFDEYEHIVSSSGCSFAEIHRPVGTRRVTVSIWKIPVSHWQTWAPWIAVASGVAATVLVSAATRSRFRTKRL
ncbi:MAG: hypothetical protein HZA46_00765 [Planctomycetales bacterium]|nr:hypothetical protein [Planctomycetales bacterium]